MNRPTPRIAIAAIFRNEHPYVLEWIAHHQSLGVARFYIADNVSDDGTSELLQALHVLGVIRRIPFASTPGQAPQLPAYADLLGTHACDEDWIAVIDADEFIVPTGGARSLAEVLAPLAAQADVGAVVLNWAIHGSAWRLNHSAGLVCERFTRRAHQSFGANHHYKTVLRRAAFASVHSNPHHFVLQPGWRCVHTDGSDAVPHARHGLGLSERVVWEGLRLNHYIVKSREEFETRKGRNGSAATVGRVKGEDYFVAHDRNDTRDGLSAAQCEATRHRLGGLVQRLSAHGHPVPAAPVAEPTYRPPFVGTRGCIDRIEWRSGALVLSGWSFQDSGQTTPCLSVQVGEQAHTVQGFPTRPRPDVQRQYPMAPLDCGFVLTVPLQDLAPAEQGLVVRGQTSLGRFGDPFSMPARK
ncbi:glycosyltransferase family 2 protein [Sphaerotilus sp.]|uniref:glycosyltransferase family 2 protein n=1 Tax=Sphaerotilus sp. TaxID=2093942 RepID=UPI0034E22CFC